MIPACDAGNSIRNSAGDRSGPLSAEPLVCGRLADEKGKIKCELSKTRGRSPHESL